jgi:selenocysteine lyase/cysteine desulfurase
MLVIDGYHAFCAVPTDLGEFASRIFYLGGGYKYAQAGEGVCFLYSPPNTALKPLNTGWFASFETLDKLDQPIAYGAGHLRFLGATFDPSGLYRWNSVYRLLTREGLTVPKIHSYVRELQLTFIELLANSGALPLERLIQRPGKDPIPEPHGHFLTFHLQNAAHLSERLRALKVKTDVRGEFIRFGFGLYQTLDNVKDLVDRLNHCDPALRFS